MILPKVTRDSQGVQVMTMKKNSVIVSAKKLSDDETVNLEKYRAKCIPTAGRPDKELGDTNQLSLY